MKYTGNILPFLYTFLLALVFILPRNACGQLFRQENRFNRQDTLRGSNGAERSWWNVVNYKIRVAPDYASRSIRGWNQIGFDVISGGKNRVMQIDLQEPMQIDSILFGNKRLSSFRRDGNVYFIDFGDHNFTAAQKALQKGIPVTLHTLTIYFHGIPRPAVNAPWDGGWIWSKDEKGRPWMTVACQGLGASVWYPCKDYQGDEPDQGATIQIKVKDSLVAVANGRLIEKEEGKDGSLLYTWQVKDPINNYNIVPYIGKYVHFADSFTGEGGKKLSLDYWVLDYHLEKARKQFGRDVPYMLQAFEYWFGPYPFYDDGYKLVESPHLGMEHQSAIAYGNRFLNGYLGSDLSGSGWGLKWDYIIVHESGHEWFGNNITTNDIADMWIHEGFTMYSEVLFTEYRYGKKAGDEYLQGVRNQIMNDRPLIGPYGVNKEGSNDMYNKGAALLHTVRQVIGNDSLFRDILRGLNRDFYHRTVDSKEVEAYFSRKSGTDLSKIFDQYLRTTNIPVLEYKQKGDELLFRWTNCIPGFAMPLRLATGNTWLYPTTEWKSVKRTADTSTKEIQPDKNFYVRIKKVE